MTRDQFLTEMMGECWHVLDQNAPEDEDIPICIHCSHNVGDLGKGWHWEYPPNSVEYRCPDRPDFSLWPDKGRLIDFVMGQEWWREFLRWVFGVKYGDGSDFDFHKYLLTNFTDLVAEYRGWKK